ncbi:Uncharacterised protein [Bordetella ansorpii]|jgi:hypothetical protein|uniref:Uncharacterized protein n=1 Tax=Bordetella ansorpii TaxID=288768 RepID=A0A157QA42_9BORD|nr:hypothetical protein [Bordetella ansorpii]SAI42426.1 Uncharacterised protein [Bordetella ansorpii]
MQYESLFWSMTALVALALVGGTLLAGLRSATHSVAGVLVGALGVLVLVLVSSSEGELASQAWLLAVASFLFCSVIGIAATLVARKVLLRMRAR